MKTSGNGTKKCHSDAIVMLISLLVISILVSRTVKVTYIDDEVKTVTIADVGASSLFQTVTLSESEKVYRIQDIVNDKGRKYFVYQPSGGWGNQRIILQNAIVAANAMKRILVLPPIAPHNFLYHGYNQ